MRNGELKEIFDVLERAFTALDIDYYLIGALARQVWYEQADIEFRTTKDVDYGAFIGSHEEYQRVKEYLISVEKFTEYKGNAFVLIAPDGTQVDILPFGEIESDGSVSIEGQGMSSIRVDGMLEVYNHGTEEVQFDSGHKFKVATLSGIALLKFIAFDDRPDQRQKDAVDVSNLLIHYFNLHTEMIYSDHNDLFVNDRELDELSAIVLGREMRKIVVDNEHLKKRLEGILETHSKVPEQSQFIKLMVQADKAENSTIESKARLLENILLGLRNAI